MNQAGDRAENRTDVVAAAIAAAKKADEMRGAAIKELLAQREQIELDLKTLGYAAGFAAGRTSRNGDSAIAHATGHAAPETQTQRSGAKRFKDLTLAEVGRVLLTESESSVLHGKEIERLAKAGGFKGGTGKFQNYLPVALKRAGGFENIGGNRWRLNEDIAPQRPR